MSDKLREELLQAALERMIQRGEVIRTIINGEPGVQLTAKGWEIANALREKANGPLQS